VLCSELVHRDRITLEAGARCSKLWKPFLSPVPLLFFYLVLDIIKTLSPTPLGLFSFHGVHDNLVSSHRAFSW
jgi:hypothetical protein